ncbi:FAU ubiquitin-like and ribosomal protein S30 [Anopheles darlingi]|uniref:FAU ubiquitin-like and ribosomal protein S30 n=1 Tax=Anopheles darlingi TaxID=43151 RepID=UPI0021005BFC|nr:FAU ubiquitin-like and ribosomal protein S30 [Anopheles darlingi]
MERLYIRVSNKRRVLDVADAGVETIGDIKEILSIGADAKLWCEGKWLQDWQLITELTSDEIDVTLPLLGGKVHGSLARAGKVKSQTPKVQHEDKKKKKLTGRALRRRQFNRRFNNQVVFGRFGKKPNSNASNKMK